MTQKYRKHGIKGIPARTQVGKDGKGGFTAPPTPSADTNRAVAETPPNLPGIVIFVHGVNSEGEWYAKAEAGLVAGLNKRLGLGDNHAAMLELNEFETKGKNTARPVAGAPPRSPVLHFYWGYRPKDGEEFKYKVPLKDREQNSGWSKTENAGRPLYWGGGPFQNGTNNLSLMWKNQGFRRRAWLLFIPLNMQAFNPEVDRQLQNSPSRTYYAHAAQRLAKLIDKVRQKYPDDTLTIVSHSQGTMVAMAATFLVKTRVPDCLMVMNSPYAMEHKFTDSMQFGNDTATDRSRVETFENLVKKFKNSRRKLDDSHLKCLRVGLSPDGKRWRPDQVGERDNHGRVYVYFNPHDRVMGSTALQSIGWQGVPRDIIEKHQDTLYQRVVARNTPIAAAAGPLPFAPQDGRGFWDGNRSLKGPFPVKIWTEKDPNHTVITHGEVVPQPISKEEMAGFDEGRATGKPWKDDAEFKFFRDIYDRENWVSDGKDSEGNDQRRLESAQEMEQRIGSYVPEPTDHSSMPQHFAFLSRVVAYDLPIGPCESFNDKEFWKELKRDADWLESDSYYLNGALDIPPMPADIVNETLDDLQRIENAQAQINKGENTQFAHTNPSRRKTLA